VMTVPLGIATADTTDLASLRESSSKRV
jgi:hypothetical protein